MDRLAINSLWVLPLAMVVAPAYAVDYLGVREAQQAIFGNAATFSEYTVSLDKDEKKQIRKLAGTRQRQDKQPVWQVFEAGKALGWFIVDDVIGKHEYITYAVGIGNDGKVLGLEIMSYRESHGEQVREQTWRDNFIGKTLADPFRLDVDVPNISGATLSCRNLLDGVKRLLVLQKLVLPWMPVQN